MASPSVPPATVEWSRACTLVRPIPHPAVSLQARMTSIATVYAQAKAAANGSWSTIAVLAAMSPAARRAVATQIELGARDLAAGLAARGILCNTSHPCRVSALKRRLGLLEVCLPTASLHAQLCEPFGERFQQEGSTLGGGSGTWCATFDVLLLARWWLTMRAAKAPFLDTATDARHPPYSAGHLKPPRFRDKRLRQLMASKNALSRRGEEPAYAAQVAAYAAEFASIFDLGSTYGPKASPPATIERCGVGAFVGSGHDLRCGAPRGDEIDRSDLVFRANAAHHTGGLPNDWLGHSLRRFRLDARRAGRKTTHRVQCLYAGQYNVRERSACILSRTWWEQRWGEESANNAQYTCCEKPVRSTYNLSRLSSLLRNDHGAQLLWFAGSASGDPILDRMRESSGGQALLAALALCARVDVYGVGLARPQGSDLEGEVVYTHFYDKQVGRCARNGPYSRGNSSSEVSAAAKRIPGARTWSRSKWRRARVGTEVLLHLFHAFGMMRWVTQ